MTLKTIPHNTAGFLENNLDIMHTQALISATSISRPQSPPPQSLLCYYATSKPKASYNQVVFKNTGCPNTGQTIVERCT